MCIYAKITMYSVKSLNVYISVISLDISFPDILYYFNSNDVIE